jgi:hypothetical protein
MPGKRLLFAVFAIAVLGLAVAAPAGAVTAGTAIANLNTQRGASGIPAGIANDASLSSGCAAHNDYMHMNNDTLGPDELPGRPGFTTAGDDAGNRAVLALGALPWTTVNDNPWETAPIHLSQLLDPSLLVSGYNESFRFSCAVALGGARRAEPASPRLYTYPGPGAHIYTAERALEGPFTPGELVGIKAGTTTGAYIFVFVDGVIPLGPIKPDILHASLRQKKAGAKPVKLKVIDSTNAQISPYIPPGGILIPVKPLKRGKYKAKVAVQVGGTPLVKRWRFNAS